jgi:hypothetical protein
MRVGIGINIFIPMRVGSIGNCSMSQCGMRCAILTILRERYAASVLTQVFQDLTITMTRDINTVTLFPKIMMSRDLLYTCQLFQ